MKNYQTQTPQNLAITKLFQKFGKTSTPQGTDSPAYENCTCPFLRCGLPKWLTRLLNIIISNALRLERERLETLKLYL